MPFADTRAGRVFYADQGAGPTVVLLHATLHDHTDFDAVTRPLNEAGYRTIALDWPGHGKSGPVQAAGDRASPGDATPAPLAGQAGLGGAAPSPEPGHEQDVTAALLAGVLQDFVKELDLLSAVFIGNSVGGFAAFRLALDEPERVAGVVLVNSGGFTKPTVLIRAVCRALGTPRVARMVLPRLVPFYMKPVSDQDRAITRTVAARARTPAGARVAAGLWRSFSAPGYDLRPQAGRVTAPVLIVCGARDPIAGGFATRQTRAAIPGAALRTLRTGHVVFASDPNGFLDAVLPFLVTVTASRSPA